MCKSCAICRREMRWAGIVYSVAFQRVQGKLGVKRAMESEQPVEKAEPVEEKSASSGTRDDNRRGGRDRRPRFRRDDRGRGGDRGERGERPRGPEEGGRQGGSVREAIRHVEHIRNDLRRVLDEMQEVL